ncbi:MAG: quinoprotein dehydrogenase-associated putative ABC transporter substrate-binding protein [Rhodospirillaceae bacterium]|nr:quinoprotein dehydrogenase-associated putative ABC transporter substrate-binding protein [Rhodospirillaceae bacterium]MBT5373940.1 quinoprotein dehydrogenase-associated putative ABC transporter substrate-binding protein [Rhodospirillaceae bacterium]MBT5659545.1 quinoprotein dehydrogenase-associated putative ABC transporter substrate-binding protein [Rhodospirillaceae bacterium]MBT5751362.1 quinoprotein dehydrogenase-associated putative ABC transporter substrate-binding protein [Rhodospirillac
MKSASVSPALLMPATWRFLSLAVVLLLSGISGSPANAQTAVYDAVDKEHFRVCADPHNMPFSNKAGEGVENKIAQLLADKLGLPLVYEWYPNITARFVRDTLLAKKCDIIMGTGAGDPSVQNTNPYYETGYVMIYPKDLGLKLDRIDHPEMAHLKIGGVAGTPPVDQLARYKLLTRMRSYPLRYDTQKGSVAEQMLIDMQNGLIDVAYMMLPNAVYFSDKLGMGVEIVPLENVNLQRGRLKFMITMGIRPNELDWKRKINRLLRENRAEINAILAEFGIPPMKRSSGRRRGSESGTEIEVINEGSAE